MADDFEMDDVGFSGDGADMEQFDAEEDVVPTVQIVRRRVVDEPTRVLIEATISEENTYIKFWEARDPENSAFCFVDTIEPDTILDTLETKFEMGLFDEVAHFFRTKGRTIGDYTQFRIRLDAIVSQCR